jgi:hypothetical protein
VLKRTENREKSCKPLGEKHRRRPTGNLQEESEGDGWTFCQSEKPRGQGLTEEQVKKTTKQEVVEFIRQESLKVIRIGMNKNPFDDDWNKPEFFEPRQEEWIEGYLKGRWQLGLICGVKAKNGMYIVVWDADSKEAYEVVQPYEQQTTVVISGGEKLKKTDKVGKEVSRHFYFYSDTLPRTRRSHDKGDGTPEYDFLSKGAQACLPTTIHPLTHRESYFLNKVSPMIWKGEIEFDFKRMIEEKFGVQAAQKKEEIDIMKILLGVKQGERDWSGIIVATWYRKEGKSSEETFGLMKEWNQRNDPPMGKAQGDIDEDSWIRAKIASAWRGEGPYRLNFVVRETFNSEEIEKAEHLLNHPEEALHFMHEANEDIVREHKTKILILLLMFGKQSLEVTGKSGSGKSELVKKVLQCLPKEWYDVVSGLTDKALRWLEGELRILVITERRGMKTGEEGTAEYDIKVGISEGEIKVIFPEKGPDGKLHKGERTTRIGSFVFTSTDPAPPPELENRIFNPVSDESEEQNIAVLDFIAREQAKASMDRTTKHCDQQRKVLRYYFEKLETDTHKEVIIPWLSLVFERFFKPNANDPAVRRYAYKLVGLIQTVSKVFMKKLPTLNGELVATPEIFWYVWQVGAEVIFSDLIEMNPRQLKVWSIVDALLKEESFVSVSKISEKCGYGPMQVRRFLQFFESKSLIEIEKTANRWDVRRLGKTQLELANRTTKLAVSLAELKKEYENWLKKVGNEATSGGEEIKLIDPVTSLAPSCCPDAYVFQLGEVSKLKIAAEAANNAVQLAGKEPLESFENAFKN